ncbi:MAG: hypothetical protein K6C13_16705 [Oscillospiraceae bacterium]|nr:hypothetical protein [Oscillospiraceae bacterium]
MNIDLKKEFDTNKLFAALEEKIAVFRSKNSDRRSVVLGIVIFCIFVLGEAWIADDSFHGFAMTRNFMNGYGLVYNIGERTNAATSPMMLLMTTFLSCITRHIELTAIMIGAVSSAAAYYILIRKLKSKLSVFVATFICIISYSFMAFTTSGLETSLIYLIQVMYFDYIYDHKGNYSFKELLYIAFLCSLSLLTRFDTCFLLFFSTAYIFLTKRECGIAKMLLAGIAGLMPFVIWLMFSVIYYGYPFPNTFYIKLRTDIAMTEYLVKGLQYYGMAVISDTITVVVIVVGIIVLLKDKKEKWLHRWIVIGILSKCIYILRIGGDFMLGRHFAGLFFVSLYIVMRYIESDEISEKGIITEKTIICSFIVLFMMGLENTPWSWRTTSFWPPISDIQDERAGYIYYTNLFRIIEDEITGENHPLMVWKPKRTEDIEECIAKGYHGDVLEWAPGISVYNYGDRLHMTDQGSVADPLLPYMPVDFERSKIFVLKNKGKLLDNKGEWRIGHLQRKIPEGYRESLWQDRNLIVDPEIHELYDKILVVVRGDLFTKERFRAIWELNTRYTKNDSLNIENNAAEE